MRVSVILCTKDPRLSFIKSTVCSILKQDYNGKLEIIVVDNNSKQAVKTDFSGTKKIRWVIENKEGLTIARLRGLKESKGDLIIYVDDDNILAKNYIRNAYKLAVQDPATGVWSAEINGKFEVKPPAWAKKYLHHEDFEIRREICHGIELRGRTHPEDILDMLKELEHDKKKRVSSTLVHVLGQIAYKKNCLETVLKHLKNWENSNLVKEAIDEIIDVHHRYRNFAFYTQEEAKIIIQKVGY
jgi:glycosyltransferase involved in cell wall biosynthesis